MGLNLKFDSRDLPINSYSGRYVELVTLFNDDAFGSDNTYQTVTAAYRAYHEISEKVVLAWEVEGCAKGGSVPLWDACRLGLRGFRPPTSWRWNQPLAPSRDDDPVPSAGLGLRFMVLPAKRINMRLNYARSQGGEAIYFSVGEAF